MVGVRPQFWAGACTLHHHHHHHHESTQPSPTPASTVTLSSEGVDKTGSKTEITGESVKTEHVSARIIESEFVQTRYLEADDRVTVRERSQHAKSDDTHEDS